ncbi:MAG TPA: hypothetical protein VFL07_04405, partial [Rudaea sp.]|nr:hypothetical protein [Rudaea sp.]
MTVSPSIIGVALAAALAAAGSARAGETETAAGAQALVPVFDCFAMNSAWGFTLSGKLIDSDGNVFSYGRRGKAWLVTPATEGGAKYYSEADLQDKFSDARRTGQQIDAAALAGNKALI